MLSSLYQALLRSLLPESHFLLLSLLVSLLQQQRTLTVGALAAFLDYPIALESRRKKIQRFLLVPHLSLGYLWLPLVHRWLTQIYPPGQRVYIVLDRTDWQLLNLLMVSIVFDKHALPLYFKFLPTLGNSKLAHQQQVLRMVKPLLQPYEVVVLGDREFCGVGLAQWLHSQGWGYCLRLKKNTCIEHEQQLIQLQKLGLAPGVQLFYEHVQVTRKKGFGKHNVVGTWEEDGGRNRPWQGWYLLTSLGFNEAVAAYKKRWGIESMFKDCKTGGYNLEACKVCQRRLHRMMVLLCIAYTSTVLHGIRLQQLKIEKYVSRRQELNRQERHTSIFKMGLYGQNWSGVERQELIEQLLLLNRHKAKFHRQGLEARMLMQQAS